MSTFDWTGINECYEWVASDIGGEVYVYSSEPLLELNRYMWSYDKSGTIAYQVFDKPYTYLDWTTSLQQRSQESISNNYEKITINGKQYMLVPTE